MNWIAIEAVSTAFTGLVILATALAAIREVRIAGEHSRSTREQLEHLRGATQFEGALRVFSELDTPFQVDARHFVQFELADRLKEPQFLEEVALIGGSDELVHKEITVLRCFERISTYVRKGWVDADALYVVASGRIIICWNALHDVVKIHRDIAGPYFWESFERLYLEAKRWMADHGVNIASLEEHQVAGLRKSKIAE